MVNTTVFFPDKAPYNPMAADRVVFPTPPLPQHTMI
jgi:hypothetical protein